MIEKIVMDYLISANIDGVGGNVKVTVPVNPPDEYIIIEKTGSNEENVIEEATMAIQSYSKKSMLRAIEINEAVKTAMREMPWSTDVFSVKLNSDYNFTDTETKEYRYQAVYNITY